MKLYDDYLRWMYRGGRPNSLARWQNRLGASAFAAGLWPKRTAALEVVGRQSGLPVRLPVVIADVGDRRYLVSMLGTRANWVRNVQAAHGEAVLHHGQDETVRLVEVPVAERPPILRRYLAVAPGARPHMPVSQRSPVEDLEAVAADYPVFEITPGP